MSPVSWSAMECSFRFPVGAPTQARRRGSSKAPGALASVSQTAEMEADEPWLTPGVRGIGLASLLDDAGHEIPTALLPSLLTSTLGAPASALGVIEGVAEGLSGLARLGGGA